MRSSLLQLFALSSLLGFILSGCTTTESRREVIDFGEAKGKTRSILDSRIEHLEKKVKKYPKRIDYYFDLATIYFSREDYRMAAEWLQRGLDVSPTNQKFLYQLGRTHLAMGEYEEAVRAYKQALKSSHQDRHTGIHFALAYSYSLNRDWKNAEHHYKKCSEINPLDPNPYYFLGSISDIQNKRKETIRYMREYLELNGKVYRKKAVQILRHHGVAVELNSLMQKDAEEQGIGPSRYLESDSLGPLNLKSKPEGKPVLKPATELEDNDNKQEAEDEDIDILK